MKTKKEILIQTIKEIIDKVENDPRLFEKMEEYQRKYGTMTGEELKRMFTI